VWQHARCDSKDIQRCLTCYAFTYGKKELLWEYKRDPSYHILHSE